MNIGIIIYSISETQLLIYAGRRYQEDEYELLVWPTLDIFTSSAVIDLPELRKL